MKKKLKESFERAYRGYKAAKESMGASSDAATGFSGENKPGQLPGGEPISGNFPPVEDPKYPKEQKPPAPPFYDPELSVEKCEVDSSCNNILECLGKLGKLIACQLGGKSKIVEPPKSSAVKDVAAKDFSSGLDSKLTDSGNAVIALVSKEGENVDASSFEADAKKHSEPPLPAIPVEYQRVTIPKGSDFVPPRLKENGVNTPTSPGVYVYQKKSKEEGGGIELMDMQSLQDYAKHVDSAGKPVGDCPGCHYMGSGGYKKLKKK